MAERLTLPGFVNAHSHAFQRALRGRTEGGDFWSWRASMLDVASRLAPGQVRKDYLDVYREVVARRGGNADIGPGLYTLLLDAGWCDVRLAVVQPAFSSGDGKQMAVLTFVNVATAIVDEGLATDSEVERDFEELARYTDDPRTIVSLPRVFQLWGRKPQEGSWRSA